MGVAGIRIGLVTAAVFAAVVAPAHAQTLTAASPTYEWSGTILAGIVVTSYQDTEVRLGESGTLEAEFTRADPWALELQIHILIPDPTGGFDDQVIASSSGARPKVSVSGLAPGTYAVRTQGAMNAPTTFDAKATLLPGPATRQPPQGPGGGQTAPPSPTPTPTPTPTPETAPPPAPEDLSDRPPSAKVRATRTGVLSGTAADDKGVRRVDVALVRRSGKRCLQMRPNFTFARLADCDAPTSFVTARGTTRWSLKLRRRLGRGRYVLFVRPLDTGNATSVTRRSFTLR